MSYGRMEEAEQKLQAEVEALLRHAEEVDEAEDRQYGKGQRGDELPAELARRESRLKKIREAKEALEVAAQQKAEEQKAEAEAKIAARQEQEKQIGQKPRGRAPQVRDPEQAKPESSAQRNFTDPESRIMPDGAHQGSFVQAYNAQAYNAQAAVDSAAQIIVAAEITQQTNDKQQLVPMLQQVIENVNGKPQVASADTGYWSVANVTAESLQGIDLHVATERQQHGETKDVPVHGLPEGSSVLQQMRDKLKTEGGKAVYKMRKQIVEPVFGYIKEGRGPPVQLPRLRKCAQRVETDLCHAQSVEALPVRLENTAFEHLTVPNPRSPFALYNSAVRLSEAEYGSPSHYPNKLTLPADKPDALDFGANFFPTSSYRAGKSVEVEEPEVKEGETT
jgi:hypothetical protein